MSVNRQQKGLALRCQPLLDFEVRNPSEFYETNPESFTKPPLWRCRESNPGPFRPEPVFYVRSRAVAHRPPRFVRHVAVAA